MPVTFIHILEQLGLAIRPIRTESGMARANLAEKAGLGELGRGH